ncbi:MAG: hypothetical protein R3190_19685 [Thermoanaerobaculia bacterium]|nr:hypothetical protein [Thermoanaerobaculia bacterium]
MARESRTWEGRARITADVSVEHTSLVEVGRKTLTGTGEEKGREASKRPAFDLTTLAADFATNFQAMTRASERVWSRTYAAKPNLRQIALDYVGDQLDSSWQVGTNYWPSRWTPEGWDPYYVGDDGATFTLTATGGRPGAPYVLLRRRTSRRHFYLQFFVSVEVV